MRTRIRPVKVKRRYGSNEWRPHFAWVRRMTIVMPGAPKDVNGDPETIRFWVFLEWIECKPANENYRARWVYRLQEPA